MVKDTELDSSLKLRKMFIDRGLFNTIHAQPIFVKFGPDQSKDFSSVVIL